MPLADAMGHHQFVEPFPKGVRTVVEGDFSIDDFAGRITVVPRGDELCDDTATGFGIQTAADLAQRQKTAKLPGESHELTEQQSSMRRLPVKLHNLEVDAHGVVCAA